MSQSLTQDPNRFSDEAWNLLLGGEDAAKRWRHGNLDVEHLIEVLFTNNTYKKFIDVLSLNHSNLLENLEEFLADLPITKSKNLFIGEDLEELLESADNFRNNWGSNLIDISHLINAIGRDPRIGAQLFEESGLPLEKLENELRNLPTPSSFNRSNIPEINENSVQRKKTQRLQKSESQSFEPRNTIKTQSQSFESRNTIKANKEKQEISLENNQEQELKKQPSAIESYGRDLTESAKTGELDPVIGRGEEIKRVIKVLSRRGKNNPVLIGSPGVGKTAIAELLAQRIINGEVPESLKGVKLISLDTGALIAGTKFRGQFEERLRSLLSEINDSNQGIILFIDELHTVLNNDRSIADANSLMKPFLASGELRCIGATTPENYRRTIEKDQALNRRFQQVLIKEPGLKLSLDILRGVKEKYENHHGIRISDEALITANRLANRYISDRCLPDKAIDLIDEAAAQLKIETTSKPQLIENLECEINRLEILLVESENNSSFEQLESLKAERDKGLIKLEELNEIWQGERSLFKEHKDLVLESKGIQDSIRNAEDLGDLEEASRLKYEKLDLIYQRKSEIEEYMSSQKSSNITFIRDHVEPEDIADVVARWTGIPVNKVLTGERQKLLDLEKELGEKVIGQLPAVQAVAAAIRRARAGMKDPSRPVGSFMFLGPTGVGKTELAKSLAASLFDEEEALIRLDMSEFMERNAVARLLGAPPGYVGYEEGGQLTEAVRQRPYAVLLLDEIEKAHPEVFNILLQVLDDGRLTDSQGRTVDFRHTVIVMTSNLASKEILENSRKLKNEPISTNDIEQSLNLKIDNALAKQFRPEFINRIDEVIRFNPLNNKDLQQIVRLLLSDLKKLLAEQNLGLSVDEKTIEFLAADGYEPEYGARPLRRVIRRRLENPLATQLLEENFVNAKSIEVKPPEEGSDLLKFIAIN